MTVFWDLLTIPFYEIWGLTPSIDIKHPHCMVPVKFEFILYIHHGERHWGDGYTGLGQLFRCPGIEGTKIRNFQFQTVAETFAIFAKSEMPMPQKDASSYPKNAVTWLRFDPIPKASTTHAQQRKCQCNSQTGRGISGPGLGMGVVTWGSLI